MNVEIYSYSLFTTVLGMLVVFLSLSALSVMMVVLKAVFVDKAKVGGGARKRRGRKARADKVKVLPEIMVPLAAKAASPSLGAGMFSGGS